MMLPRGPFEAPLHAATSLNLERRVPTQVSSFFWSL